MLLLVEKISNKLFNVVLGISIIGFKDKLLEFFFNGFFYYIKEMLYGYIMLFIVVVC